MSIFTGNKQRTSLKGFLKGFSLALGLMLATHAYGVEQVVYYHFDALGSPVAASDATGNYYLWKETYQPYGERIQKQPSAAHNSRWYTGHPHEEDIGLTYMGARWYDPVVGRFMGVDPQEFTEANPHSFNRYNYANNNPYKYVDPDGREPLSNYADPQAELEERSAGRGDFGPDFLDYALTGMDSFVPVGGGVKLGGKLLEGAGSATKTVAKELPKPTGIPSHWISEPAKKAGGTKFVNPQNKHDYVRAAPGNPKNSNPAQQQPYTVRMKDGKAIDSGGNPVNPKTPEAHIPSEKFKFIP